MMMRIIAELILCISPKSVLTRELIHDGESAMREFDTYDRIWSCWI